MLEGIEALRAYDYPRAKELLTQAATAYPQHAFLQHLTKHLAYRETEAFSESKADYEALVGTYTISNATAKMWLDDHGDLAFQFDRNNSIDPFILFEIEKDVFAHIFSEDKTFSGHPQKWQARGIGKTRERERTISLSQGEITYF